MNDATRVLNRRIFYEGDKIFNEGDLGTHAFMLQKGRVRISKDVGGGRQGTLGYVEPGGIFGEMALVDRSKRMASAIAEESSVCIVITEEALRSKLTKADPSVRVIILALIRLLRHAADKAPIPPNDLEALSEVAASLDMEAEIE